MALLRRIALIIAGLVLTLIGQVLFSLLCGPNRHLAGALLGAMGGAIIGVRRRGKALLLLLSPKFGLLQAFLLG